MTIVNWKTVFTAAALMIGSSFVEAAPPLDYEEAPVSYSEARPQNALTELQDQLQAGKATLPYADDFGYLLPMLKALDVPVSSQMLPFSKTSLQRPLIGPDRPRALYFNDDAYVGYVQDGMLEMMVTDPKLGLVFYTLEQTPVEVPRIERQVARCMTCHASTRTKNIPGLLVRSMHVDPEGLPVISAGSFRTDHSSPLAQRWGGWYVTGQHGTAKHLGNFHLPDSKRPKKPVENKAGQNRSTLAGLTNTDAYPRPHSDLVALLVFEHQIDAHNYLIRTHYAWHIDEVRGKTNQAAAVWKQEADQLVKHLLFDKEAKLESPVQGTSGFQTEFAKRGPFDSQGRSLRQFDLKQRLFQYPCSYMIYSQAFQSLAQPVRAYVYRRLKAVLTGDDLGSLSHEMSEKDRQNLLEILPATIPELKMVWKQPADSVDAGGLR